ncbi:MAG TPA: FG-GAP-like repeat-containing protein, partial [Mucilaginibacter sp.]
VNNHNLTFTNKSAEFGLDKPAFSNGSMYADLDNDGDNDLVVNNVNSPLYIYKNNAEKKGNHYIQLKLKGSGLNSFGVGATIKAFMNGSSLIYYNQPTRGFQSATSPNLLTIGIGKFKQADSLQVIWPGGKMQTLKNVEGNKAYTIRQSDATGGYNWTRPVIKPVLTDVTHSLFDSIPRHKEDDFIDFDNEKLMLQMLSTENPYMAAGDVNNDGLTDFYFGSSKNGYAAIYIQQKDGRFKQTIPDDLRKQEYLENAGAVFGDFDGDGDQDLIIGVGGNADEAGTPVYMPRFYENDGKGNFHRNASRTLPAAVNASVLASADYDGDGRPDLFIGGRSVPGLYGCAPQSYVFHNEGGGRFTDVSAQVLGKNTKLGMVTAAKWADLDKNGSPDLVVAGNWMGIRIFKNNKGHFTEDTQLNNYKGWWSSLEVADVNGDGNPDIIGGNIGLNSKFRASFNQPMKIYVNDFDHNGTKECVTSMYRSDGISYVFHMKPELVGQLPMLKKRFLQYADYAGKPFNEVFTDDMLEGAETHEMNYLASAVFLNDGRKFTCRQLPAQAQLSMVNTILCDDIDGSGNKKIIMAGNFYGFKPEVGRLDANYGQVFQYNKNDFDYISPVQTGFDLRGQVTSSLVVKNAKGVRYYLFGINDAPLKAYKVQ